MSVDLNTNTVEVFKFHDTGLVALCAEVLSFVGSGDAERRDLVIDRAYFEKDALTLRVVFPYRIHFKAANQPQVLCQLDEEPIDPIDALRPRHDWRTEVVTCKECLKILEYG